MNNDLDVSQFLDGLAPLMVLLILVYAVLSAIRLIGDAKTRNRLIHRGVVDERLAWIFRRDAALQSLASFRLGLILIANALVLGASLWMGVELLSLPTLILALLASGLALVAHGVLVQTRLSRLLDTEPDR